MVDAASAAPGLASRILRAAPTRLFLYLVAMGGVASVLSMGTRALLDRTSLSHEVRFDVFVAVFLPAMVGTYVGLVRWLERRRVTELRGPGALRELAQGFAIGAALFSVTIGIIAALGGYAVVGRASPAVLLGAVAMTVESGVFEEILFRGVLFRVLEEWLGTWAALVLSSAFFGLAHLQNEHATLWAALAIALEAGTMLAGAYLLTRRLWLAIGLHAAWNFTQGAIFGVAVSGTTDTKGLLVSEPRGPDWLSGGAFGAETSVVAMSVCSVAAALMLRAGFQRYGVVAPSWVRRRARA
jgi:membrane protease YdiL (CAAX protease family)